MEGVVSESEVKFLGPGPFSLPIAQSARARASYDAVEMTLSVIVGDDPHPRPLYIPMGYKVARQLAEQLAAAAIQVDVQNP